MMMHKRDFESSRCGIIARNILRGVEGNNNSLRKVGFLAMIPTDHLSNISPLCYRYIIHPSEISY